MAGVVYVFQDHYPWDVRAEKFVSSFVAQGIETSLVSRNRTGEPTREEMDGYTVRRLPRGWGKFTRELQNFPAFFSPFWINAIVKAVREQQAELILVRDLPLTPAAYWAAKITKVPVVMDMAEDYPAMLAGSWKYDGHSAIDVLVRNPKLLGMLEQWIVPRLDGVVVVSEASAKRVKGLLKRDAQSPAIEVVGNTPRIDKHMAGKDSQFAEELRSRPGLKMLYVGWVNKARGISTAIQSLEIIKQKVPDITLVVVGDGVGKQELETEAQQLGLADHVLFPGWIEQDYVPQIVAAADICLVPHYVEPHTNTTLPNKIYDYMFHARPVLVTHSASLREVIEACGSGLWYHDKSPPELADAVFKLTDPKLRAEFGANGRDAVLTRLNWDADAEILVRFVARFTSAA